MNYGSTESQSDAQPAFDRQSSITTSVSNNRRPIERKFLLPGLQVFGYSVGHIHNDICSAMWFTYLLVFMESVLLFDTTTSGLLLLIGQIADGLATPIVGFESDRDINTCSAYGKRKTWHLVGTIVSLATFPFIFQPCYGGEHASRGALIFYYSMLIILFQFAWASVQISHLAMATDLTPYSCERVKLTARRSSFTVISNILVYLFTWLVLHVGSEKDGSTQFSPDDAAHFRVIVISLVGLGVGFSILFHVFVRERPHNVQIKRNNNEDVSSVVDFSDRSNHLQWKHWFRFTVFYQVAGLYMVSRLVVNLTQVFIPLYLHHTLDMGKESVAYIPLTIYCSGFFGSFLVELLNKRMSNLQIFFYGSVLSLSAFIWIYFGTSQEYTYKHIYLVSVLIGLSGQIININSQSILNDMIGQNTASSAFVFGAMSLLDKGANGTAVMIIQILRERETLKNFKPFFRYVLSYVCGGSSIVAILILFSLIPHNFDQDLTRCRLSKFYQNVVETVKQLEKPDKRTDEPAAGLESKIADKQRTNKSRSYGSTNANSDFSYPIRRTNNLVDYDGDENDEERRLLDLP